MESFETFEKNLKTNKNNDRTVLALSITLILSIGGVIALGVLYWMKIQSTSTYLGGNHGASCEDDQDCLFSHSKCVDGSTLKPEQSGKVCGCDGTNHYKMEVSDGHKICIPT